VFFIVGNAVIRFYDSDTENRLVDGLWNSHGIFLVNCS
jgi:hypothetical protein